MPETETLALTREEKQNKQLQEREENCICCFLVFAIASIPISLLGGIIFWLAVELTVQIAPNDCFDLKQGCEVLQVEHAVLVNEEPCQDRFTYTFLGVGSPAEYIQSELIERAGSNCSVAGVEKFNGTFQVGPTPCFVLRGLFGDYKRNGGLFCAQYSDAPSNPEPVGENECFSLLQPQSDFIAIFPLVAVGIYCIFAVQLDGTGKLLGSRDINRCLPC